MREWTLFTFKVNGSDGELYTLRVIRREGDITESDSKPETWKYTTTSGQEVRRLEKGKYRLRDSGTILTSEARYAP